MRTRRMMMSILRDSRRDFDFLEKISLHHAHLIQPNQFKKREKRNYNLDARDDFPKQFRKAHGRAIAHPLKDHLNLIGDTETLREDLLQVLPCLNPLDYILKRVDELENSD